MGMFKDLMDKIFRSPAAAAAQTAPAASPVPSSQSMEPADVAGILDKMASENKQKLDWRHSIVDLMKLVGMDSSLNAR